MHRPRAISATTGRALRRLPGFVFLLFASRSTPLDAQWLQASVGLGAASVRYAQTLETTMVSLTPSVSLLGAHGVLSATGVLASTSAQGVLSAAVTTSFDAPLAADLAVVTGGSRTGTAVTQQSRVTGRVQLRATRAGLWLGTGVGRVADGSSASATRVHDLGAWLDLGAVGLTLTGVPTAAGDTVRVTDTELGLHWDHDRLTVDATAGWRTGTRRVTGLDDPGRWRSVTGSWRVSERLAIVAGAGSYPLDLLQGFPAGRFTTVSLRFTPDRAAFGALSATATSPTAAASGGTAPGAATPALSALVVRALSDGRHRIRVRALGATTVELQGSMTAWAPVPLTAEGDGWFAVDLPIAAGTHELVLRRDGGAWTVPPGLTVRVDEFGMKTGVVVV